MIPLTEKDESNSSNAISTLLYDGTRDAFEEFQPIANLWPH